MKKNIPLHQAVRYTPCGIFMKEVFSSDGSPLVTYAHCDDYYIFGLVEQGCCRVSIDFCEREVQAGEVVCVRPGQVHQIVQAGNVHAFLLFMDSALIDADSTHTLSEYALFPFSFRVDAATQQELIHLFAMIRRRMDNSVHTADEAVVIRLSLIHI